MYGDSSLSVGQRVELHPNIARAEQGDRFGKIVGFRAQGWRNPKGETTYRVTMCQSGDTVEVGASNVRAA